LLGAHHPTIWKLIDGIKKKQSLTEVKVEQLISGQPPPPSRKVYRDLTERLRNVMMEYGNLSELDYLRGIAFNIDLNV